MTKRKSLPNPPLPAKLETLASWAEHFDRESATWLRRAVIELLPTDPRSFLKSVLRRYWRMAYFGESRTAAARLIALDWAAFHPGIEVEPGSAREQLARLVEGGFRPLKARTIAELLDPSNDRSA